MKQYIIGLNSVKSCFSNQISPFGTTKVLNLQKIPFSGRAPKGPVTYAFTHGEISPSPAPLSGWDLGLWAEI